MIEKEIWDKAYKRIFELDGNMPNIRIINRFYHEKMLLGESNYIRYLDLLGRIRARADELGEHIFVRGTVGSSLIAYLLGATDINPIAIHKYFGGNSTADELPFEMNLRSVFLENIQLGVSRQFFKEAKEMICKYMSDKAIVTLKGNEEISLTWLCFLDKDENDDAVYSFKKNCNLFESTPHITLAPTPALDKYREIEAATGVKMKDAHSEDMTDVFTSFIDGEIDGVPCINTDFLKELIKITKPQGYDDILKLIGITCAESVWRNNAEKMFCEHRFSLRELPVFRDDIYMMIRKKLRERGIYENGFAYEVMSEATRGVYNRNGMDEMTMQTLMELGFDMNYISFLKNTVYMFSKAHAVSYLKNAITMMWYKIHYPKEYHRIFMK